MKSKPNGPRERPRGVWRTTLSRLHAVAVSLIAEPSRHPFQETHKMRYRLPPLATALMALTVAFAAAADGYDVVGKPTLGFTAVGPGGLKINGTAENMTTIDQGSTLVFKSSLKDIRRASACATTTRSAISASINGRTRASPSTRARSRCPKTGRRAPEPRPENFACTALRTT